MKSKMKILPRPRIALQLIILTPVFKNSFVRWSSYAAIPYCGQSKMTKNDIPAYSSFFNLDFSPELSLVCSTDSFSFDASFGSVGMVITVKQEINPIKNIESVIH